MRHNPAADLWQSVLGELELQVARPAYQTFLKGTKGASIEGGVLTVSVPTPFAVEWIEKRLYRLIQKTVQKLAGRPLQARFRVNRTSAHRGLDGGDNGASPPHTPIPSLSPRYTFSSFVVGPSNHLAYTAAQAAAETPGTSYNPLFIYAGVGLGKTHLLQAIAHEAHLRHRRFVYATSERFTNEFISSIRDRTTNEFRKKYRSADLLLIDDIQFIAGKEQTQEGFFHTFNELHNAGRQIVIASDRPPQRLSLLEERLRSRFQWGLIADVQVPDLETRIAIAQTKAQRLNLPLADEVAEYLAQQARTNVRELEGTINRLYAYCAATGTAPDISAAQQALSDCFRSYPRRSADPDAILRAVSAAFTLSLDALVGRRRDRRTATARHVAMYLLRKELHLPLTEIGRQFSSRDHSSVAHAVAKVARHLQTDPDLNQRVDQILTLVSPHKTV